MVKRKKRKTDLETSGSVAIPNQFKSSLTIKNKGLKKYYFNTSKKVYIVTLVSDTVKFKTRSLTRYEKGQFLYKKD